MVVEARNAEDNRLAQLAYTVAGNYDMKGGLREGRITFEIAEGSGAGVPIVQGDRWEKARDLNARLYRTILGVDPRGTAADNDLQHIYRLGYAGMRDVALELAREAESRYGRLSEEQAVRLLGDLYRGLLLRNASDSEMWGTDRGFRGNVQTLRDRGLSRIIEVIVDSEEFRSSNQLYQWGSLTGSQLPRDYSTEAWLRDRGRPIRY